MAGKTTPNEWSSRALNAALVVLGVGVAVLLYGFVTGSVLPGSFFEGAGDNSGSARPEARRAPSSAPSSAPGSAPGEIVQVAVRNGSGAPGIAAQTTRYLRSRGFDVVEAGNHTSFDEEQSFVVDRVGDLDAARRVAAALGIPEERVRQDLRPEYYLDASVVLGRDYASLRPFRNADS